ncbi:MAG: aspartate kinase [Patescibacteria group bacterium]|nr:aspartate kinase [Patescibacteria group bacterium]
MFEGTVDKFGGTSVAAAENVQNVADIVSCRPEIRVVVVSAPGERFKGDARVTNLLRDWHAARQSHDESNFFSLQRMILERFRNIEEKFGLHIAEGEVSQIKNELENGASLEHTESRGEYIAALLMSKILGFNFLDAASIIKFDDRGSLLRGDTRKAVRARVRDTEEKIVVPGYYGTDRKGAIRTFSRGGSDITGALIAAAVKAERYRNWSDSNLRHADPRIVKRARHIRALSYEELREFALAGASVFHPDAVLPVQEAGVPTEILNSFDPTADGTLVFSDAMPSKGSGFTGVAGERGFSIITIRKPQMNDMKGYLLKPLASLNEHGVSIAHLPTGIESLSIVVKTKEIEKNIEKIVESLKVRSDTPRVEVEHSFARIALVGRNMARVRGVAGMLFTAIAKAGVNVRTIDQGAPEMTIAFCVNESDYEKAIRAAYNEFFLSSWQRFLHPLFA